MEWDKYTTMPVVAFLTLLCFYKDKQELEAATIKALSNGD